MARATEGRAAVLRTGLLVLLDERAGHGYELAPRLAELGIEADMGALYRTLRAMDRRGEVRSFWDGPVRGPARRVYRLTDEGRRLLHQSLERIEEQRLTLTRLLLRTGARSAGAGATTRGEA